VVVLAAIVACATPVHLGWTTPPLDVRTTAEQALAEARAAGAREWAPELLSLAETMMRMNLAEERLQSQRLLPLRDYRVARDGFVRVARQAQVAHNAAGRRVASAKDVAATRLADAKAAVDDAEEVLAAAGRQPELRRRLTTARLLHDEARLRFEAGEYPNVSDRARVAEAHARAVVQRATALMERYVQPAEVARWQHWIDETIRWSKRTGEPAIVVSKDDHRLTLYVAGRAVHTYPADIGLNNLDDKERAGDHATPEGRYKVTSKRNVGQTAYYKALMLDYPNRDDRKRFEEMRRRGQIPRGVGPGSLIEIHGEGGRDQDWTRGCVAVSNEHMDQLFSKVRVGTPVTIVGGRGAGGVFSTLVRDYAAVNHRGSDDTAVD
jgi:L,D-peptidoglycan transpeptidase YkuD (ErfK/YbiS/YcfS/YnhG family)